MRFKERPNKNLDQQSASINMVRDHSWDHSKVVIFDRWLSYETPL